MSTLNQTPYWLDELRNRVMDLYTMTGHGSVSAAAILTEDDESDVRVVVVYERATELVGGAHDGTRFRVGFVVEVAPIVEMLGGDCAVTFCSCPTMIPPLLSIPHVMMRGHYDGNPVWVCLLAYPPPDSSANTIEAPRAEEADDSYDES